MKENNPIGVEIFSGAGGLGTGAALSGIEVAVAVEKDLYSIETYKRNHPKTRIINEDIRNVSGNDLINRNPFIVFGGPPCQGFSLSNTKTRNENNENNHLFLEFIRIVKELQPDWFLFENVAGIMSYKNGETVKKIQEIFKGNGYKTNFDVLFASDYGVPQARNRFFMVGNKHNIDFAFPSKIDKKVTVEQALTDLPELKNGDNFAELPYKNGKISEYAKSMRQNSNKSTQNFVSRNQDYVIERYKHIQQGQNWKAIPDELMQNYKEKNNCHSGIYKRLEADKPSVILFCSPLSKSIRIDTISICLFHSDNKKIFSSICLLFCKKSFTFAAGVWKHSRHTHMLERQRFWVACFGRFAPYASHPKLPSSSTFRYA